MKKIIALALVLFLTALLAAGCGKTEGTNGAASNEATIDTIRTLGDVIALEGEDKQYSAFEGIMVYVFKLGDTYYRVRAELPEDVYKVVWDTDFIDEEQVEKMNELLAPIEITAVENLNEQLLTIDEMKALVGKTGQELLDDGWYSSGYNLETMQFWMNYGPFMYTVVFDGKIDEADWADFDENKIEEMTVRSVEFLMLGDATNID